MGIVAIIIIIAFLSVVCCATIWWLIKKVVYGVFYTATKAIENGKKKDYE